MSERAVARRYAGALFDVAQKAGISDRAGRELAAIAGLVAGHADLRKTLESPAIPTSVKKEIVAAILDRAGGISAEIGRLMSMMADRDRLGLLAGVEASYATRLLEAQRIVPADVVSAAPLSDAARSALSAALGSATGFTVTLNERVDPELVGGVVARVGSMVFDGSVTRQLDRLRQQLTAQA